jgi:hypothetical protein
VVVVAPATCGSDEDNSFLPMAIGFLARDILVTFINHLLSARVFSGLFYRTGGSRRPERNFSKGYWGSKRILPGQVDCPDHNKAGGFPTLVKAEKVNYGISSFVNSAKSLYY